jgi:hypothetical protein
MVTAKFLKSVTDAEVPNVGAAMVAWYVDVVVGVPADNPVVLVPVNVSAKALPPFRAVLLLAKPVLTLRCAEDNEDTVTSCEPTKAAVEAVTLNAVLLLLAALTVLKLSLSFTALNAVLSSDIMNITADRPLTLLSFLVILALMALACGARSASTKFCAKAATSTPEPALRDEIIFCALALLAAATCAAVVVAVVAVEDDETAVVAIYALLTQ